MNYSNKNILIISHNPLSFVNNNGKTLASIFEGVPKKNIYQIYLTYDIPDYSEDCHYLQINEKQILTSILHRKNLCCCEIKATPEKVSAAVIKSCNFGNHTKRLLRECVWKFTFWKSKLADWLKNKQFDVVFFMAGDGLFAYDVYRFIMKYTSAKCCLFFTDDYILGRNSYSPAALFRQFLLKKKIKETLKITKELYVISDEMREAYKKLLGVDGYVIRNFSVEKTDEIDANVCSNQLYMVYAGGLHFNRWKVLSQIANCLKKINESSEVKCYLKIYSSQNISKNILKRITVEDASEFLGSASASQIANIYSMADILLHVESFEKKSIQSTKYSFSTKIPEYLSAGKCLFAVGPSEVASIKYLSKFSCVCNENDIIFEKLYNLINDNELRKKIKIKCEEQFIKDFSTKKQQESLKHILQI